MAKQRICDICKTNLADMSFKIKQSTKNWNDNDMWRNKYVTIDVCNECGNKLLGFVNYKVIPPECPDYSNDCPTKPLDIEKMTGKKQ